MLDGFPNQVSSLVKIGKAVEVFRQAHESGINLGSDSLIGELLLRSEVIAPRSKNILINDYLIDQRAKLPSNRSFEASTRGIRELLLHLRILERSHGEWSINDELTHNIYNSDNKELTEEQKNNWRNIFNNMTLGPADYHPYRMFLRFMDLHNRINRKFSSLCFEATADTDEELDRINQIALQAVDIFNTNSENRSLEEIIAGLIDDTSNNVRNAVKIIPALALQVGDISLTKFSSDTISSEEENNTTDGNNQRKGSRKVSSDNIAQAGLSDDDGGIEQPSEIEGISPEEMLKTIELRRDRLRRHNLIVKEIAILFEQHDFLLYEDPYDCFALKDGQAYLIEVKTLNGIMGDEIKQVRGALSQLKYYETFSDLHEAVNVKSVAVFEGSISKDHKGWLEYNNIEGWSVQELKDYINK